MSAHHAPLAGDARLPLYQRLAELLKNAITEGRWRPGDRLPSENELSQAYDVAPGTVRQAIGQLVDEGLLERRQGKGTYLRKPTFDSSLFRFFRFQTESGERKIPESRILRRDIMPAPSVVAGALQIAPETPVISVSRLRLLEDEPVMAEEIWLEYARFQAFAELADDDIGPLLYPIYDSLCGHVVANAQESLTVEAVNETYARLLRLEPNAAVVVIERIARGYDGTALEWRRSRGRADRFRYQIDIQ